MSNKDDTSSPSSDGNILSFSKPEGRFPKAAIDYIDTLLDIQRARFDAELSLREKQRTEPSHPLPERPKSAHIHAEGDNFIGAGWSSLGTRRDGTSFRWMGRLGSLMVPLDMSEKRPFSIFGCGFTKRRFLKETTLWFEDQQIPYALSRKGFNRWYMEGELPPLPPRPYYIMRLQAPSIAKLAEGLDTLVSLAVSEVRINC